MIGYHYLVKKKQKLLLTEDNSWIDLSRPFASTLLPKVFLSAESAKAAQKRMRESNKIGIYNDTTLYTVFGVHPEELLSRKKAEAKDAPDKQVPQEAALSDAEQYAAPESSGLSANIEKTMNTPLITDLEDTLACLIALFDRLSAAEDALPTEKNQVERILQDELHFSEFEQLNIVEGYQAWRRIHDARIERRRIKNETEVVQIAKQLFDGFDTEPLQKALNLIESMRHRSYAPRSDSYPTRKSA